MGWRHGLARSLEKRLGWALILLKGGWPKGRLRKF